MKKYFFAATFSCALFIAHAQESTFNQGNLVFNAGLGIGTTLYSGTGWKSVMPPISLSGEYGVADDFITDDMTLGIGGYIGIASSEYRFRNPFFGDYGWKYSYTIVGVRGAVHYPLVDKLDTYGGLMLGFNVVSVKEIGDIPAGVSSESGGVVLSAYIGGRYYLTDNFALMAEIGYGIAWLNIGVALKL